MCIFKKPKFYPFLRKYQSGFKAKNKLKENWMANEIMWKFQNDITIILCYLWMYGGRVSLVMTLSRCRRGSHTGMDVSEGIVTNTWTRTHTRTQHTHGHTHIPLLGCCTITFKVNGSLLLCMDFVFHHFWTPYLNGLKNLDMIRKAFWVSEAQRGCAQPPWTQKSS